MATTREDIREWLERGIAAGATHVVVAVDRFSYEDYPIFIAPHQDVRERIKPLQEGKNMQGLMEVYKLSMDLEKQLNEHRVMNL